MYTEMHKNARHKMATLKAGLETTMDPVLRPLFIKPLCFGNGLSALHRTDEKLYKLICRVGRSVEVHAHRYV